jgi:histidinol-phosphate aminotransferase
MKTIETYVPARTDGILLNANENSNPLSTVVKEKIAEAVSSLALNRYPDSDQKELLAAYAGLTGVSPDQLLAGNGSDQMLGYMIGTFLGKGKTLCTLSPDFSMYDYYASSYEADVVKFRMAEDGTFNTEDFIAFAKENKAGMILFSNPNNPTGHCLPPEEIEKIASACNDIPVVVDEAYIDFADTQSSLGLINEYPNLYLTRTLSKAYGLAALRTGFLISSEENMKPLKQSFVPYALNSVSMKIASTVLQYAEEYRAQIEKIKSERQRMYEIIKDIPGLKIFSSEANFLYGRSDEKEKLLSVLNEKNITIRDYSNTPYFRITIGTEEENELVLSALKQFGEEG